MSLPSLNPPLKTKRGPHPRYGQLTAGLPPFRFRGHPAVGCPLRLKHAQLQLPDLAILLSASSLDDECIALLREGTEALVGVLGTVSGGLLDEIDGMTH